MTTATAYSTYAHKLLVLISPTCSVVYAINNRTDAAAIIRFINCTLIAAIPACRYVPGSFSWSEARADALTHGGVLAAVLDERYHDATVELLQESAAPQAWIGATANQQLNTNAWRWIERTSQWVA